MGQREGRSREAEEEEGPGAAQGAGVLPSAAVYLSEEEPPAEKVRSQIEAMSTRKTLRTKPQSAALLIGNSCSLRHQLWCGATQHQQEPSGQPKGDSMGKQDQTTNRRPNTAQAHLCCIDLLLDLGRGLDLAGRVCKELVGPLLRHDRVLRRQHTLCIFG